jgi:hypothetical protein
LQIDQIAQDAQRLSVNRIGISGITSVSFIGQVVTARCRRSLCVFARRRESFFRQEFQLRLVDIR